MKRQDSYAGVLRMRHQTFQKLKVIRLTLLRQTRMLTLKILMGLHIMKRRPS
ncbi:hypothetical protein HMPREF1988_00040 [Porphyromonas gingivalis F0185]|uniref:Uncharacterized protein n=1 Tax=Porphyromonas gingivalis F0570 TaxID=1227271 RepID=A0A0E2LST0_PORGN|nr:hypothetical protein HMPREF1555_00276 [Porphyromonas gingivalis F0570]ERJ86351.1 hypothetical protein HMPREF1988_00040 [Porphyromonas gingivalis F0185]